MIKRFKNQTNYNGRRILPASLFNGNRLTVDFKRFIVRSPSRDGTVQVMHTEITKITHKHIGEIPLSNEYINEIIVNHLNK